jgi:rfaE bifunctional protein nucleotidyltransferase chain/domain
MRVSAGSKFGEALMENPGKKIMSVGEAREWRNSLRSSGRLLVFTNGCFDLLHRGHVEYLIQARQCGGALLIALNSDASVKNLKDTTRPLNNENDRAFMLAAFYFVDAIVIFNEPRCANLIAALSPDIYVKGGDYDITNINSDEKRALLDAGTQIKFIKFIDGYSTSSLIGKIKVTR